MKLISLNTWGGKFFTPLMKFIKDSEDTDIFCFQEVFNTTSNIKVRKERRMNLYEELTNILTNHQGFFAPFLENYIIFSRTEVKKTGFNLSFGLAIFIKKEINIKHAGNFFIYGNRNSFDPKNLNSIPRISQYISFTKSGKNFIVCNLHGIWVKEGKSDTPSRLNQSRKIIKFLGKQAGKKILCGDFNLDINTQSIKILEENFKNLIREYNIQTTRNKFFPGNEKHADYTFVTPDINVGNFEVPDVKISDHLPMTLEFS